MAIQPALHLTDTSGQGNVFGNSLSGGTFALSVVQDGSIRTGTFEPHGRTTPIFLSRNA